MKWNQAQIRANTAMNSNSHTWQNRGYKKSSCDINPKWKTINVFSKMEIDKKLTAEGKLLETQITAGEIFSYDDVWEKCRVSRP